MGHDISAYIKTKSTSQEDVGMRCDNEVAYFRINAFNTPRQRMFYGLLTGSESANAGVSGNGSTLNFTRGDIETAIEACKYYLDDETAVYDNLITDPVGDESNKEMFVSIFEKIFPDSASLFQVTEATVDDIRENIADIWKFHEDILSAYDDVKSKDDSAHIQIYFG